MTKWVSSKIHMDGSIYATQTKEKAKKCVIISINVEQASDNI